MDSRGEEYQALGRDPRVVVVVVGLVVYIPKYLPKHLPPKSIKVYIIVDCCVVHLLVDCCRITNFSAGYPGQKRIALLNLRIFHFKLDIYELVLHSRYGDCFFFVQLFKFSKGLGLVS
jgi:hypothetical protein